MTDEPKFPHDGVYRPFCRVSYWTGNAHCSDPRKWDRCTVTPTGLYTFGEQTFTHEERHRIQPLLSFLDRAFESGRADAKAEIRHVLGVK